MGPLRNAIVLNYFDDYFILARNWSDMKDRLHQVLVALEQTGLTLRAIKCVFAAQKIDSKRYYYICNIDIYI